MTAWLLRPSRLAIPRATRDIRFHSPGRAAIGERRLFSLPDLESLTPSTRPQTFHASRVLPYASGPVYHIIADVANYARFLPYCSDSTVTAWATARHPADPADRRPTHYPSEATLTVGYGAFRESFASVVRCDPAAGVVDAVSGEAAQALRSSPSSPSSTPLAAAAAAAAAGPPPNESSLLKSLRTRWTISPVAGRADEGRRSKVDLRLEFQFANPVYAVASQAATPFVAEEMVKAFEGRVEELLGRKP